MSNKPYYYVMYGVTIPQEKFPGNYYDEKWLPYTEGHEGVEMSILSGDTHLYCGKILTRIDPYGDNPESQPLDLDFNAVTRTNNWTAETFDWYESPKLMLVTIWL